MSEHDILVIGASAGGVEALSTLVRSFPPKFSAAIFVVLHIPAEGRSMLPTIFNRIGHLPACHPEDGASIKHGQIYIAPPDHHLLIEQEHVRVVRGPRENRHRPAIDPLFRSAARAYGPRVIGVVLTGALDDGTAGLLAIKRQGGLAIVQDPQEALYSSMPQSALKHVDVDVCCSLAEMAGLLPYLIHEQVQPGMIRSVPNEMEKEVITAAMETNATNFHTQIGHPSVFSCPECGGVLWEIQDGTLTRFRCRTGHAFTPESMLAEQSEALERALWFALKTLEERANLTRDMMQRAYNNGHQQLGQNFAVRMNEAEEHATLLREVLGQPSHNEQINAPLGQEHKVS